MAIQTQLINVSDLGMLAPAWADAHSATSTDLRFKSYYDSRFPGQVFVMEYDTAGTRTYMDQPSVSAQGIVICQNGDTLDTNTGIYTFVEGSTNRFQTPDIGPEPMPDPSDPNLRLPESVAVGIDSEGVRHYLSKALNFKSDQLTITTHADGTVTVTMPQDLVLNAITAQSATFDGDITVGGNQTTAGNQVTTGTTQTKALILDSYTQADVDAGNVPANSLVRIVG